MRTRSLVVALVLAGAWLPVTPPSSAAAASAVISSDGAQAITIVGTPGPDAVTIFYIFQSETCPTENCFTASGVAPGANCTQAGSLVSCALTGPPTVTAYLGAGDDRFEMPADRWGDIRMVTTKVHGGAGNDRFLGSYAREFWYGDAGDDVLIPDRQVAIEDDYPDQEFGPDDFNGGPGFDTIDYSSQPPVDNPTADVRVTLDGLQNDGTLGPSVTVLDDNIRRNVERVLGGPGSDVLIGATGRQVLAGRAGDDVMWGGPGRDVLRGGPGDDLIRARDGMFDRVQCGPGGADRARVDRRDRVRGCERVSRR